MTLQGSTAVFLVGAVVVAFRVRPPRRAVDQAVKPPDLA